MTEYRKKITLPLKDLIRFFLIIFLPLSTIVAGIEWLLYYSVTKSEKDSIATNEVLTLSNLNQVINKNFKSILSDLMLLAGNNALLKFVNNGSESKNAFAQEFFKFSLSKGVYDQIRFFNKKGMEVLRVNFNNGLPTVVPETELQSKANRYYFKETMKLDQGKIYVSPFDLNIDNGIIERPLKPTIRFGTPVFDALKNKQGMILLNFLGKNLLNTLENASITTQGEVMLLNSEGYRLYNQSYKENWGFMFEGKNQTMGNTYPDEWKIISEKMHGQFLTSNGMFSFVNVYPLLNCIFCQEAELTSNSTGQKDTGRFETNKYFWKIVSFLPPKTLTAGSSEYFQNLLITYAGLSVLLAALSLFLARTIVLNNLAEKELRVHRAHLEELVRESTAELEEEITERKAKEKELILASEVIGNAVEGIMITNVDSIIQSVNSAFTEITGYSANEVIGVKPNIIKSGRQDNQFYKDMWDSLIKNDRWQGEIWNRRKNGQVYPERITITAIKNPEGVTTQYAAMFYDITEIKQGEKEIEYKAYHDTLTGLPNRQLYYDRLKQAINNAKRNGIKFSVLFIDLDNFKHINDSLGHDAGDILLKEVAKSLICCVRDVDTVSRFGGDEFAIIQSNITEEQQSATLALRIIKTLSKPFKIKGKEFQTSISLGIAVFPGDGETEDDLLKNADLALYHVKDKGKNGFHFFTDSLNEKASQRMELEIGLRKAINEDGIIAYFQPKVDLKSGKIVSIKALARWRQANGKVVLPAIFLNVAEETGLITDIDKLIFEKACAFTKRIHETDSDASSKSISVSVNLSALNLENLDLSKYLTKTVGMSGLKTQDVELEITEGFLFKNDASTIKMLRKLHNDGFKFSIAGFGTGNSSLLYLTNFPLNSLKIDKKFVKDLPSDSNIQSIAKGIVYMAHEMNINVVAEGVETLTQLDFLRSIGCNQVLGNIFSQPLPENKMEELLLASKPFSIT